MYIYIYKKKGTWIGIGLRNLPVIIRQPKHCFRLDVYIPAGRRNIPVSRQNKIIIIIIMLDASKEKEGRDFHGS